jgi:hypothetical protein
LVIIDELSDDLVPPFTRGGSVRKVRRAMHARTICLRRTTAPLPPGAARGLFFCLLVVSCRTEARRDLSHVPAGQVGFEDLCGLQSYFDTLAARKVTPPALVEARETEGARGVRTQRGGTGRFAFQTDFQLRTVRRVLNEHWKRLPDGLENAPRIDLEVQWTEKAGVRRVVTERDATLIMRSEEFELPYHVCLSELLFGESLYRLRRETLQLLPLAPLAHLKPDGGVAADAAEPDLPPALDAAAPAGPVPGDAGAPDASVRVYRAPWMWSGPDGGLSPPPAPPARAAPPAPGTPRRRIWP